MSRFTNSSSFPTFHELLPNSSTPSSSTQSTWYLLAQIKENMTITMPTLIVTDRAGIDFALLFEDEGLNLKEKGYKKGYTIVVPNARRTDREGEGKKAVVRVPKGRAGDVKIIPGRLDRVLELGVVLEGADDIGSKCAACGRTEGKLMKCTGCEISAYCGKECQVKGWSEMDHKSNCKVLKALQDITV